MATSEAEKAYKRAYYEANRERRLEQMRVYAAANREQILEYKRAYYKANREKAAEQQRARYEANREKAAEQQRAYRAAHREQVAEYHRAYRAANQDKVLANSAKRRARKRNAPINDFTAAQWKTVKAHYGHRCVYCGKKPKQLSMDHITPLAHGGSHTMSNIVPACLKCNISKQTGAPPVPVQPLLL